MTYWEKRAKKNLLKTEKKTEKVIDELVKLYDNSFKDIEKRIKKIFDTYAINGQMDKLTAIEYLNAMETEEYYEEIRRKIDLAKSEKEKQELFNIYNSRAYGHRISRLMAVEEQMYLSILELKGMEEQLTRKHYEDIIISRYKDKIKDNVFTATTKYELKQMLDEKWLGSNFSKRIWKNEKKLTNAMNEIVKVGFFTGKSNSDIARELRDRMQVGIYEATRLVRTESNYYHNQIELKALKDMGIDKYRYLAVLDKRTSNICRELDGKVFKVSEAKVGYNCPSMHPFCRSTIISAYADIEERIARDYETNENYKTKSKDYKEYEKEKEEKSLNKDKKNIKINKNKINKKDKLVKIADKNYEDITDEMLKTATPNSHEIKDLMEINIDGKIYNVGGKNIVLDYSRHEKEIAEFIKNKFGGKIYMYPRVNVPEGIRTPDYLWNGEKWDLKDFMSANKYGIENLLKKKQANNYIINITNSKLKYENIIEQIKNIYLHNKYEVDKIMIIRDSEVLNIFKKK